MIKIQTFKSFNKGSYRCSSRSGLLYLNGFTQSTLSFYTGECKPLQKVKLWAEKMHKDLRANNFHAVYFLSKDYNGCGYYEVWYKYK